MTGSRMRTIVALLIGLWICADAAAGTAIRVVMPSDRVQTHLNVRAAPDSGAPVVARLAPGERLRYLGSRPYWHRVALPEGGFGYVSKAWSVVVTPQEDEAVRIGVWNIRKLGHGKRKDYRLVAKIIDSRFDLVAVVEIMQKAGSHPGFDALAGALGDAWQGMITASPRPNTSEPNAEFYGIFYRPHRVRPCETGMGLRYLSDHDGNPAGTGPDRFRREPAYVCMRVVRPGPGDGVDFVLGIYHAIWARGNRSRIRSEVGQLPLLVEAMRRDHPDERDLWIVGDFNLDSHALAEVLPYRDMTEGRGSTLNRDGERTQNLYDHLIVVEPEASGELIGPAVVVDPEVRRLNPPGFYRTISDHLPIVTLIDSRIPDDD